ncbi:MAG: hypothetical protein OEU32_14745 [Acidimicrobiia bacterium]|nr:hypothetical protein [Acidimicrobiia bacterium]
MSMRWRAIRAAAVIAVVAAACGGSSVEITEGDDTTIVPAPSTDPADTSASTPEPAPEPTATTEPPLHLIGEAPDWRYSTTERDGPLPGDVLRITEPVFEGGTYLDAWSEPTIEAFFGLIIQQFFSATEAATPIDEVPSEGDLAADVTFASPGLVAVEYSFFTSISGSARPNLDYIPFIYDLIEQRLLEPAELFVDEAARREAGELALDAIAAGSDDIDRGDLDIDAWNDGLASVVPTVDGLRVSFGRDEILPGAFGGGAVTELSWAEVDGLVQPWLAELADAPQGNEIVDDEELPEVIGDITGLQPDLPFGTPTDVTLNTLGVLLGPATDDSDFVEATMLCEAPFHPTIRQVTWGDLTLTFTPDGGFVEWFVEERGFGNGAGFGPGGIGIGSTVAAVEAAFTDALDGGIRAAFADDPTSPGLFNLADDSIVFAGITSSIEPDGTVTSMWSGIGCQHLFL